MWLSTVTVISEYLTFITLLKDLLISYPYIMILSCILAMMRHDYAQFPIMGKHLLMLTIIIKDLRFRALHEQRVFLKANTAERPYSTAQSHIFSLKSLNRYK
jgi:hypothetical protein